ncbi:metal-sensitive transcriptional regulator [Tumebacillus permanentifrigoris]|uniref:DNA-binding FrmR family transcriptional regulator n=1 Tax=Tumebacillus permanentifrigoris TaxID=378543 RepID=A0A316DBN1_9BACL|nr:metal-sensitive transcriptional regulator [Tumebacillus permanentifrigoris]PWK14986.1 DNA-binding FrmR family transcriptional regulator [Tumebacillus permanentifrigoris]
MEYNVTMKNRLRRVEGQVRGVLNMMEQEKDCREVVTQLTAVRTAIDRALGYVIASNLESCIRAELEKGQSPEHVIKDAVEMLVKSR